MTGPVQLDPTSPPEVQVGALGTILSVWAHPDDESYLAAGVMALARVQGQRVVCVSATAGEHGTDDATTWPPDRLGRVRRWEAAAAMAVLGVDEHEVHDLGDGELDDRGDAGVEWAEALIERVAPDTILTFGPDGMTHHPDHRAVSRWVGTAWERMGRPARLLHAVMSRDHLARFGELYEEWGVFMTDERPDGVPVEHLALHLQLEGELLDRKVAALRAMATQTADVLVSIDPELWTQDISVECFVDASRADFSTAN